MHLLSNLTTISPNSCKTQPQAPCQAKSRVIEMDNFMPLYGKNCGKSFTQGEGSSDDHYHLYKTSPENDHSRYDRFLSKILAELLKVT